MALKRLRRIVALSALCACCATTSAQQQGGVNVARAEAERGAATVERGSLEEIRDKRSMMLVVGRSFAVDARAPGEVSAEDVRAALDSARPRPSLSAYRIIGAKLNRYIRAHHTMTAVEASDSADFYVVFKIMREHTSLINGLPVTYGKLFVVVRGANGAARVLWESKGEMSLAEDAAGELIRALKEVRGER